jgi:hypothetical protein
MQRREEFVALFEDRERLMATGESSLLPKESSPVAILWCG